MERESGSSRKYSKKSEASQKDQYHKVCGRSSGDVQNGGKATVDAK